MQKIETGNRPEKEIKKRYMFALRNTPSEDIVRQVIPYVDSADQVIMYKKDLKLFIDACKESIEEAKLLTVDDLYTEQERMQKSEIVQHILNQSKSR